MNAWPFVIAAYGLTLGSSALLTLVTYRRMRRIEAAAAATSRRD